MDSSNTVTSTERDCNALGGLFHIIINDLRGGIGSWDDLLVKANKFHAQLKATIIASTAFLDSFQKIADLATTTRGGTKEIGSALTRLCLRHRSVEAKFKSYTNSMLDSFILPLQDRVEEWKRIILQIDKDHSKELKRLKQLKKKQVTESRSGANFGNTTFRIKRNPRTKMKSDFARVGSMYDLNRLIESMECKEKYFMLEEVERNYVRRALIEERSHYCLFFNFLRPIVEEEISMLQEMTHLEEVLNALVELTNDPYQLPPASESLLTKLHLNESSSFDFCYGESRSPNSTLYRSRKSSISSITSINSFSTDSISLRNCKSLSQPAINPEFRPKSIASQDSGFISHDYNVPNIGRMVVPKSKSIPENVYMSSNNIKFKILNASHKNVDHRKSITSCKNCLDGEYASADQLYSSTIRGNRSRSLYSSIKQPIYANVDDQSFDSLSFGRSMNQNQSSDGSVTPTNQGNMPNYEDGNDTESIFCTNDSSRLVGCQTAKDPSLVGRNRALPKSNPPKPPTRHSSTLTGSSKPPMHAPINSNNGNSSKSTLIYVMQDNGASLDFPPPPPEAYVNYAAPSFNLNEDNFEKPNQRMNNEAQTLEYSLPNNHLILCNDINCLREIQPYGSVDQKPFLTLANTVENHPKSYVSGGMSNNGNTQCPIYSDCSPNLTSTSKSSYSHTTKIYEESERAKSVPANRRFHNSSDLSSN